MKIGSQKEGFSLVEMIIAVAILAIIAVFVYQGFAGLISEIRISRLKTLAATAGGEHLEFIRSLPIENIGILGVDLNGLVPGSKDISRGVHQFTISTEIENVDNELDGLGGADDNPIDFKKIYVEVACQNCSIQPLSFTTQIAIIPEE